MRYRVIRATTLSLCLAGSASAEGHVDFSAPDIAVFSAGIYCAAIDPEAIFNPNAAFEETLLIPQDTALFSQERALPATPGLAFGVAIQLRPGLFYEAVEVEMVHPPFAGSGITRETWETQLTGESPRINGYSFDEPGVRVPGTWVLSARLEGRLLFRAAFEVLPEDPDTALLANCAPD